MRTFLITGGAGFFGGILARMLLEQGHRCISLDVQPCNYYRQNKAEIRARREASAHRSPARMGIIRLLKWVS